MLDPGDFALDGTAGHYQRELPERWCFGDRAFGGYTAAIALAAVLTDLGRDALASASVLFVEAGVAGPIEIDVQSLRSGRTATASQVTVHQDGRPILVGNAWAADSWAVPATTTADPLFNTEAPSPDHCDDLPWVSELWPALQWAERRGVDYPTSYADFARGEPSVALWARVVGDGSSDPLRFPQLADVLHLDAHLFDAPGQAVGFVDWSLLSLDLTMAWQPGSHAVPSTGWRLFEARGSISDGGVTSFGSIRGENGALLCVSTSQGLLRHHR